MSPRRRGCGAASAIKSSQLLIADYGWRSALVAFAAVAAMMALISIAIGQESTDASTGATGSDSHQELLSTGEAFALASQHRGFIAMVTAFFACGFQLLFITTHLPEYLTICGLPPSVSASALGLIGLGNAAGSYVVGQLGARFSQKRLLALIYLLRTLAIVVFLAAPISPASALLFAAAMGFLWLSVALLVSGLIGRMFGLQHFNMLFGVTFLSHQVGHSPELGSVG